MPSEGDDAHALIEASDNGGLDLTGELFQPVLADPSTTIDSKREDTRKRIAFALLGLLSAVAIAWVLIAVLTDIEATSPVVPALDKIFSGVLALTGTAVGFYFGASSTATNTK